MILNIRGTNGSGKSTIARAYITAKSKEVELVECKVNIRQKRVLGYSDGDVTVVGRYTTACGGMDGINDFATSFRAIEVADGLGEHVLCEGILASTVFGSWKAFANCFKHGHFAFVYLHTPLDVCLKRIYERNGGKKINEKLVADKFKTVLTTREKAIAEKFAVYDLPVENPITATEMILQGKGDQFRAS